MIDGAGSFISITMAAFANFGTQYNFNSIAVALLVMSLNECTLDDDDGCRKGDQANGVRSLSSAVIFIGAIIGQLSMGFLGDFLSRNNAMACTLLIASISALLSAILPNGNATTVYAMIIVCRLFLGVGLGGIFPLSATKASEDTSSSSATDENDKVNPIGSSWAFFWQMPGFVSPWFIGYLLTYNNTMTVSFKWRFLLGLGALPLLISSALLWFEEYLQRKQDDSKKLLAENSGEKLEPPAEPKEKVSIGQVIELLKKKEYRTKLVACGVTWLLFDIVSYGATLLGGYIIDEISNTDDNITSQSSLRAIFSQNMTALVTYTPGCLVGILALPYMGMKKLQVVSFIVMAVCFVILASIFTYCQNNNQQQALFGFYCVTSMSIYLGLGVTTFCLPSALFEKNVRSTFNGVAAAMGKVGAFLGAFSFPYIASAGSYPVVLGICAGVSFLSAIVSQVYIDEELLNKNVSFESLQLKPLPILTALHTSTTTTTTTTDGDETLNAIQLSTVQPGHS